ncbi:neuroendocrine convertase 1-like [Macrosteles quadrilineatus]|uniref:neuroendocrine convertase 1-like n=1 Tax=Macrosteles quadrilineatus TaxID=74068 RepID=UPI0023E26E57|nr:neuroendocrine convertase 1-like [Macrosteles quadrilineatus]
MSTSATEFTNMWIAEVDGGEQVAQRVARDLGYTYGGKADAFEDHYVFTRDDHPEVSKRGSHHLTRSLTDLEEVKWAEQQSIVKRTKRGVVPDPEPPTTKAARGEYDALMSLFSAFKKPGSFSSTSFKPGLLASSSFKPGSLSSSSFKPGSYGSSYGSYGTYGGYGSSPSGSSKLGSFDTTPVDATNLKTYQGATEHIGCHSSKPSAYADEFNDPLWTKQWYAQDYRTKDVPVMDLNLVPVYRMGITGKSVKVAVVDDGVQHGHPDLQSNFLANLSYDMTNNRAGSNPDPSNGHPNSHGTKCAGEIAMVANNNKCGVGVAYDAKVAGVKVLGHRSVDYVEARGLIHMLKEFDIYSNSWGPADDGQTMEQVGRMTDQAFDKGASEGRKGKGAIYVFAGGNGKHQGDNCGADGLVNNAHTIGISSVSQNGKTVYYSERCTAIYAGAYSGGNSNDEKVATIDLNGGCTTSFSGTSAAAPIASGIIALVLEANPKLTVRDIYHIISMGAEVAPVADNGDIWYKNGRGFWVSNDFGFGLLNAENMVKLAKSWTNVPKKKTCVVKLNPESPIYFTVGEVADLEFDVDGCLDKEEDNVKFLEQLEVTTTVQYPYRGAITITITSPSGTKTTLLEPRPKDSSKDGLQNWSIKSVHNWGEDPKGVWEIEVKATRIQNVRPYSGYIKGFILTLHGTSEKPAHFKDLPRKYAAFRLPNGKTSEV